MIELIAFFISWRSMTHQNWIILWPDPRPTLLSLLIVRVPAIGWFAVVRGCIRSFHFSCILDSLPASEFRRRCSFVRRTLGMPLFRPEILDAWTSREIPRAKSQEIKQKVLEKSGFCLVKTIFWGYFSTIMNVECVWPRWRVYERRLPLFFAWKISKPGLVGI